MVVVGSMYTNYKITLVPRRLVKEVLNSEFFDGATHVFDLAIGLRVGCDQELSFLLLFSKLDVQIANGIAFKTLF